MIFFRIFRAPKSAEAGPVIDTRRTVLQVNLLTLAALNVTPRDSIILTWLFGVCAGTDPFCWPAPRSIPTNLLDKLCIIISLCDIDMSGWTISSVGNDG